MGRPGPKQKTLKKIVKRVDAIGQRLLGAERYACTCYIVEPVAAPGPGGRASELRVGRSDRAAAPGGLLTECALARGAPGAHFAASLSVICPAGVSVRPCEARSLSGSASFSCVCGSASEMLQRRSFGCEKYPRRVPNRAQPHSLGQRAGAEK